ncbi:MBL fold metallo-hydrolase [Nocardioidaceae bacterium]|nr:MBL fold metallo-hydrolase [Nocardioidaceae bacterium]
MQLTKLGHACVRLEKGGQVIVVDPGVEAFTPEADALEGVSAVLVTHEHPDHLDVERLRAAMSRDSGLVVVTCRGAADSLLDGATAGLAERVQVLHGGDSTEVAGFAVTGVGDEHALNHPDAPVVDNVGMMLDGRVVHLGDALTPTDAEVVLVAAQAPWMSVPDQARYLKSIPARRILGVHDGLLKDVGLGVVDRWLEHEGEVADREARRLRVGETVEV